MTQQARPKSDVFNNGWTPQPGGGSNPLSADLQGAANDTRYVSADLAAQGSTFEVQLAALAWPDSGPQTLTVRLEQVGGTPSGQPVTVLLLQGSTLIAQRTVPVTSAFVSNDFVLTAAEVQTITDYTNLRAVVSIGSPTTTDCGQFPNGAAFQLSFTPEGIANGDCSDCAGVNVPTTLTYTSGCSWVGPATYCGGTKPFGWLFRFASGGGWILGFNTAEALWTATTWDGRSPLTLTLSSTSPFPNNCTNFPATITLTPR